MTVNLESWHLTCSAPPTANGEALRQKAYARSVPIPILILSVIGDRYRSRRGTPARFRPSILLRAFPDSFHSQLLTRHQQVAIEKMEQVADRSNRNLGSYRCATGPADKDLAGVVLRAFRQMMVGIRNQVPYRPPVFLFFS